MEHVSGIGLTGDVPLHEDVPHIHIYVVEDMAGVSNDEAGFFSLPIQLFHGLFFVWLSLSSQEVVGVFSDQCDVLQIHP